MSFYSEICYLIQQIPLLGLLGYTVFALGTAFILFFLHLFLRNLVSILTDPTKLPCNRSTLKLLILVEIWWWLFKLSDLFGIDIGYTRSFLNLAGRAKGSPTVTSSVEKVNEDCEVYVYNPHSTDNRGCVLYIHGGGFGYLSAYAYNPTMSWMSHYLNMVVVSVEYRLAPEHPYPAALTDCYNSLTWVYNNKNKLDIDLDKIFVAGDSAGGTLSAAFCLLHQDKEGKSLDADGADEEPKPPLAGQILIYPALQGYDFYNTGSMVYNSRYFPFTTAKAPWNSRYILGNDKLVKYLGRPECYEKVPKFWGVVNNILLDEKEMKSFRRLAPPSTNSVNEANNGYIYPLHDNDLSDLPPAYILVASGDTLKDDGVWYAAYLKKFGNKVVLKEAKSCHGFMQGFNKNELARKELMGIKQFIDNVLKDL